MSDPATPLIDPAPGGFSSKSADSRHGYWQFAGALLLFTTIWCVAAGNVIYCAGERMIGFHPLVLGLFYFAIALAAAIIINLFGGRWPISLSAAASLLMVGTVILHVHRLEMWGWSRSLAKYDAANRLAIERTPQIPDLSDQNVFSHVISVKDLPAVRDFSWYCPHQHVSRGFHAFRYRGVIHVRIKKIRNGCLGVALIQSPADREALESSEILAYDPGQPIAGHWLIWRLH